MEHVRWLWNWRVSDEGLNGVMTKRRRCSGACELVLIEPGGAKEAREVNIKLHRSVEVLRVTMIVGRNDSCHVSSAIRLRRSGDQSVLPPPTK